MKTKVEQTRLIPRHLEHDLLYCAVNSMSRVHTVFIARLHLWYRNCSNKVLVFEAVYDVTWVYPEVSGLAA